MQDVQPARPPAEDRSPEVDDDALVDAALVDSFPASDPPPWTLGVVVRRPPATAARARPRGFRPAE